MRCVKGSGAGRGHLSLLILEVLRNVESWDGLGDSEPNILKPKSLVCHCLVFDWGQPCFAVPSPRLAHFKNGAHVP